MQVIYQLNEDEVRYLYLSKYEPERVEEINELYDRRSFIFHKNMVAFMTLLNDKPNGLNSTEMYYYYEMLSQGYNMNEGIEVSIYIPNKKINIDGKNN